MIFDTHVHTEFSSDSTMRLEAALKRGKEINIGLITTEHMDLNYPDKSKFNFDIKQYFATYQKYRGDNFLLGIEIGMAESCAAENKKIIKAAEFDYVLGSIHTVNDMDIYYDNYYHNKSKKEAYEAYFKAMFDCIGTHSYINALGHIDYIARYARYSNTEIYYNEFSDFIDEVLKRVIENNIVMEINTRRLKDSNAINVVKPIYQKYHDLGGKFVTLGSDAHQIEDIGGNFVLARDFASACNLETVYFKNGKVEYIK